MKKLLMAAVFVVALAASAFASGSSVNVLALRQFKSEFKSASDVRWSSVGEYAKVSFVLNDERLEAFYDKDGEVVATAKAITLDVLPLAAKRKFAQKYDGYTVKEAIKLNATDEEAYFISAENEKESVIVKVSAGGFLSVFQKTSK